MTIYAAMRLAKLGRAVRRDTWSASRTLQASAGRGSTRSVCLNVNGSTATVLKNTDLTTADYSATDWREA
jgi:hypothetical protein